MSDLVLRDRLVVLHIMLQLMYILLYDTITAVGYVVYCILRTDT